MPRVERAYNREFLADAWTRRWTHKANNRALFQRELARERASSGFGLDDPYQIWVADDYVETLTVANGVTLQEKLVERDSAFSEEQVRALGEQLCLGLIRLHTGLRTRHGSISPFNIRISNEGKASFWSVPSVATERSSKKFIEKHTVPKRLPASKDGWVWQAGKMAKQRALAKSEAAEELGDFSGKPKRSTRDAVSWGNSHPSDFYSAPEEPAGQFLSDIFSVGVVLYHTLMGSSFSIRKMPDGQLSLGSVEDHPGSEKLMNIIFKCVQEDPLDRFLGPQKLALALNPESDAGSLNIPKARELTKKGLQLFRSGQSHEALEHFQEARDNDRFSVAAWNNIAVVKAASEDWTEAICHLERAYNLSSSHPTVSSNIAHCLLNLGDNEAADFWANQALCMDAHLVRPNITLSTLALCDERLGVAVRRAQVAVNNDPESHPARVALAKVWEAYNSSDSAQSEWQKARELLRHATLSDCLVDEEQDPPWGAIRIYGQRRNDSDGFDDGGSAMLPRRPHDPRPSRSATRPYDRE